MKGFSKCSVLIHFIITGDYRYYFFQKTAYKKSANLEEVPVSYFRASKQSLDVRVISRGRIVICLLRDLPSIISFYLSK